jgi:hypothetical protein
MTMPKKIPTAKNALFFIVRLFFLNWLEIRAP